MKIELQCLLFHCWSMFPLMLNVSSTVDLRFVCAETGIADRTWRKHHSNKVDSAQQQFFTSRGESRGSVFSWSPPLITAGKCSRSEWARNWGCWWGSGWDQAPTWAPWSCPGQNQRLIGLCSIAGLEVECIETPPEWTCCWRLAVMLPMPQIQKQLRITYHNPALTTSPNHAI